MMEHFVLYFIPFSTLIVEESKMQPDLWKDPAAFFFGGSRESFSDDGEMRRESPVIRTSGVSDPDVQVRSNGDAGRYACCLFEHVFFGAYRFRRGESFPEKLPGDPQIRNIKQMGEIGQSMNWMRTVTLLSVPQRERASIS